MWLNNADDEDGKEEDKKDEKDMEDEKGKLVIDSSANSFEAYVNGFYSSSHYSVSILRKRVIGGVV